jgi:hypothetical protein
MRCRKVDNDIGMRGDREEIEDYCILAWVSVGFGRREEIVRVLVEGSRIRW